MQSVLPKTRRLLAITTFCVALAVLILDAIVLWLPAHPRWDLDARFLALITSIALATLVTSLIVTVRRLLRLARASHTNEQRFLVAAESSFDSFYILESVRDRSGEIQDFRFVYLNTKGAALLSGTPKELTGKLLCEAVPLNRTDGFFETYKRVVETGEPVHAEFPISAKEVRANWLSHQVGKLADGVAIMTSDITDRKQREMMLLYLAQYDSLTGLPRRMLFEERLAESLQRAAESGHYVGLLMVDCDHFKRLNDLLGHTAVDDLLVQAGKILAAEIRDTDTVARTGGDEFLIVLDDLEDAQQAETIAQQMLRALQAPMKVGGESLQVTVSIGVGVFPEAGRSAEDLLKNAAAALYEAKADGRNRVQVFTREMAASLARRRAMEAALKHAIERDEFEVLYQPRISLLTGAVSGVEALLRWNSRGLGRVMPSEFIPIAEANGLIVSLGRWVIDTACREISSLYPGKGRSMQLAVNVSPRQFQQQSLASDIEAVLNRYGMEPSCLEIEITESLLLHESPETKSTFEAVRALGVSIAIDDFGTGYSSMSYLMRFRVERLKIDQSFVRRMVFDAESDAICRALIGLAKALNIAVVAEGVETAQHRDLLWTMGCEEAQGHLYSVPVPIGQLGEVVEEINRGVVGRFLVP